MGNFLDSWWNVVLVALFGGCVYFYDWSRKQLRYFQERNICHVKMNFLTLFKAMLAGTNITDGFDYIYKCYPDEPYVGYYRGLWPAFLIRDPTLVEKITKKNFSNFHDRGFLKVDEKVDPLTATLVTLSGDKWKLLRSKLSPAFTSSKLKWMFPIMQSCANSLAQHIRKTYPDPYQDVNAKELFSTYTLSTLVSCGFGIEPESVKDPESEFRKMLTKSVSTSPLQMVLVMVKWTIPSLFSLLNISETQKEVLDYFVKLTKTEFKRRKTQDVKRTDFVQLLMEIKEKEQVQHDAAELDADEQEAFKSGMEHLKSSLQTLDWTDEMLVAQMLVFFQAGFENSSQLISVAAYHLSKNADIQERVRKEIREAKGRHGTVNYQAVKDMKLLDHCVSETLRLLPPAMLLRICTEDYTLDDGVEIKKGMTIGIPVMSLQKDPKYWKKPEEYLPDRFDKDKVVPGTYLPFGQGPRICIGERFAMLQVKLILAKVLEHFELLPSPKMKEPLIRGKYFDSNIVGGVWVRFRTIDQSSI